MMRKVPLRTLLVLVVMVLSGIGMGASSLAVDGIMRDFVYSRVDQELAEAAHGWARRGDFFNPAVSRPPTDYFVAKSLGDGTTLVLNDSTSSPKIENVVVDAPPVTVPAAQGTDPWRVIAVTDGDATTVVARSIAGEEHLLHRLAIVQVSIGFIVLFALAMVAFGVILRSLKPLRTVEDVASCIANGEIDKRVPELPRTTEVGQLAHALNIMLAQLQALIDELTHKEEQMRRFVGDASHELRTPLTSVRGFAELYRSGATDDACYVLGRIEEEAARMGVLVEDLLALTRAEDKQLMREPVDLLELGNSVASSLRAAHPDRVIEVVNDSDDGNPPILNGDSQKLRQVMVNLVNNALVHAGPDAVVRLGVFAGADAAIVTVADDGVGMNEHDAAHVFDRFYRADASRNRNSGGSGLGLAIVKSIVTAHNGTVEVDSALGRGTTFRVCLPYQQQSSTLAN